MFFVDQNLMQRNAKWILYLHYKHQITFIKNDNDIKCASIELRWKITYLVDI